MTGYRRPRDVLSARVESVVTSLSEPGTTQVPFPPDSWSSYLGKMIQMQYKDPASPVSSDSGPDPARSNFSNVSWLGRFKDNGWAIKISPSLTGDQWNEYACRADEVYVEMPMIGGYYSITRAFDLLREIFPGHVLSPYCPAPQPSSDHSMMTENA